MAQLVKGSSLKWEELSLTLGKPGLVAYASNLSTGEVETR